MARKAGVLGRSVSSERKRDGSESTEASPPKSGAEVGGQLKTKGPKSEAWQGFSACWVLLADGTWARGQGSRTWLCDVCEAVGADALGRGVKPRGGAGGGQSEGRPAPARAVHLNTGQFREKSGKTEKKTERKKLGTWNESEKLDMMDGRGFQIKANAPKRLLRVRARRALGGVTPGCHCLLVE